MASLGWRQAVNGDDIHHGAEEILRMLWAAWGKPDHRAAHL